MNKIGASGSKRRLCAIPVWLIEHHRVAAHYLQIILQRAGFKVLTNGEILTRQPDLGNRRSVFLIDGDILARRLSAYLQSVRANFPHARVLVLGRMLPNDELCRLLFLGVHGFVSYDKIEVELRRAIQLVWEGHLWVPADVLEEFTEYVSALSQRKKGNRKIFTARESLIIGLPERKLSDKEISSGLGISERTVKFHLQNIFNKLGVHDRHSVVELAKSSQLF